MGTKKRRITEEEKNQRKKENQRRKLKKDIIQLSIIGALVVVAVIVMIATATVSDGSEKDYIDHGDHTHPITNQTIGSGTNNQDDHTHEPNDNVTTKGDQTTTADTRADAIDFTVYDAAGNGVLLSDFAGRPIVVNFWTSWCTYCKLEMPHFEEMYKKYPDVIFLMINVTDGKSETKEMAQAFINENGYTFPVYYDTSLQASGIYRIESLPTTVFIDSKGKIADYKEGALDSAGLEQRIELIRE